MRLTSTDATDRQRLETDMATNVVMPQMGESIAEGTIARWIKKVGDSVDRDEPLFEISTDKVDAEIPSPSAGVLTEIRAKEGETVPVNSVVATIGAAGEKPRRHRRVATREPQLPRRACPSPLSDSLKPSTGGRRRESTTARRVPPLHSGGPGGTTSGRPSKEELRRQKSSPAGRENCQRNTTSTFSRSRAPASADESPRGHSRVHRVRGGAARRRAPPRRAAGTGVPSRRGRRGRADERDAQKDRRSTWCSARIPRHTVYSV